MCLVKTRRLFVLKFKFPKYALKYIINGYILDIILKYSLFDQLS